MKYILIPLISLLFACSYTPDDKTSTKKTIVIQLDILKDGKAIKTFKEEFKEEYYCDFNKLSNQLETRYYPQNYKCSIDHVLTQTVYRNPDVIPEYTCKTSIYYSNK